MWPSATPTAAFLCIVRTIMDCNVQRSLCFEDACLLAAGLHTSGWGCCCGSKSPAGPFWPSQPLPHQRPRLPLQTPLPSPRTASSRTPACAPTCACVSGAVKPVSPTSLVSVTSAHAVAEQHPCPVHPYLSVFLPGNSTKQVDVQNMILDCLGHELSSARRHPMHAPWVQGLGWLPWQPSAA